MATVSPGLHLAVQHAALEAGRQNVAEHDERLFIAAGGKVVETHVGMRDAHQFRLRAVDRVAEDPAPGGAVGIHLLAAILHIATGADAGDQDMVSRLERGDGRANLVDNTDALMA